MGQEGVIIYSIVILGGIGLACGTMLLVASKFFSVPLDERVGELIQLLPGANCGACGFAGCAQYAKGLIAGAASSDACRVLDQEKSASIASLLGVEGGGAERTKAVLRCQGGEGIAQKGSDFMGLTTCRAAALFFGGDKDCPYACLGFGDCVEVCPFQAISRGKNGLVAIDPTKCTGCGKCIGECPKGMLHLVPERSEVIVACLSKDRAKRVNQACKKGCIACRRCEKACPVKAISVEDNLARIDFQLCDNCGLCVEACPTKSIIRR